MSSLIVAAIVFTAALGAFIPEPMRHTWATTLQVEAASLLLWMGTGLLIAMIRRRRPSGGQDHRSRSHAHGTVAGTGFADADGRRLLESGLLAVFRSDREGRVREANTAFLNLVGATREDLESGDLHVSALTSQDCEPLERRAAAAINRDGRFGPDEVELVRRDGRRASLLVGAARSEAGRTLWFATDLTGRIAPRKELEQMRAAVAEADQAKGDFLDNVSHELRTPMNAIMGMTELALQEDLTPRLREYLETVRTSSDVLMQLLTDVLDFSRIQSGLFDLEPAPFDLRDLFDGAMRSLSLSTRAREKDLELAYQIDDDVPDGLVGDPQRLRQVLVNLVDNAVKFTQHGEVEVHVEAESRISDEVCLHFSVRDTGIGISQEHVERIFAPFTQADASTTRNYGGTGLGLAIVQELVLRMGGRVWVDSVPGEGSTFHFTARFPLQTHAGFGPRPGRRSTAELRGTAVLVVDDNQTNRRILHDILTNWAMRPVMADDSGSALRRLGEAADRGEPIPLAIVDAMMPGMDGFTLVERIHSDPRLAGTKVLMLSSGDRREFSRRSRELNIAAYLEKPVSQAELRDAFVAVLRSAPLPAETAERRLRIDSPPERPLRLLVAEDMPANEKVVTAILTRRGHQVEVARNGREAVEMFRQGDFDLVLMDVQMPAMDGLQATGVIRSLERPAHTRTPIVAMTAHAMRGDRERCLAAGMDAYVSKPIDAGRLIELVESLPARGGRPERGGPSTSDPQTSAAAEPQAEPSRVFDREATLRRLGGDEQIFGDMVRLFNEDVPGLIERLRDELAARSAEEAARAAHSLKGLSSNFSAPAAVEAAARVESLCQSGDLDAAERLRPTLEAEIERLQAALAEDAAAPR